MNQQLKNHYYGWAQNQDGASMTVGHAPSIRKLEDMARRNFGSGWKIEISRIDFDGEGGKLGETEVKIKTFTIR